MRRKLIAAPVAVAALLAVPVSAQSASSNLVARFALVEPFPALAEMARTKQIPLDPIDPPGDGGAINPGDFLTALVTFFEKNGRRTQWLLYLEAVTPNAKEQTAKPQPPLVMHSSTGNKLEFLPAPAFVNLRTLGPFAEPNAKGKPPKALDKSARFALNKGFLSLGLDRASAVVVRLNAADPEQTRKNAFSFGAKPFSADDIAKNRKVAESLNLTADDERALAGAIPALLSYFDIVQRTEGLDDILYKILDLPSFWSMVTHAGVDARLRFDPKHIGLAPESLLTLPTNPTLYRFPVTLDLNKQPALDVTLIATAPQPPLLTCGGIVGMLVERPGGEGTHLTLRVISARSSAIGR